MQASLRSLAAALGRAGSTAVAAATGAAAAAGGGGGRRLAAVLPLRTLQGASWAPAGLGQSPCTATAGMAVSAMARAAAASAGAPTAAASWRALSTVAARAVARSAAPVAPAAAGAARQQARGFARYLQFQPRSGGGWGGGGGGGLGRLLSNPDTVLWGLIGLNLGGFVMWRLNGPMMATHATVSIEGLRAGRAWTVLTSAFSHRDFGHLAANMLGLFFFGRDIGRLFGGRKLLALYLAGGALGSLAHCGWYYYKACQTGEGRYGRARWFGFTPSALGASAAVNAITVVDILLYPTRTILLYGIIPLPAALLGALWLFRDISGTLDGVGHIAHAGHLGGAATGLAFYLAYRRGMIRPRGW